MITRQHKQNPTRRLWMPLATVAFLGYFGFHAFNGSYGIWAKARLENDRSSLALQLSYLKHRRGQLEKSISSVRPESLDAEIVDVEARTALNMMREDEVVIRLGASQY
jgi:cell division protein FtsB